MCRECLASAVVAAGGIVTKYLLCNRVLCPMCIWSKIGYSVLYRTICENGNVDFANSPQSRIKCASRVLDDSMDLRGTAVATYCSEKSTPLKPVSHESGWCLAARNIPRKLFAAPPAPPDGVASGEREPRALCCGAKDASRRWTAV